MSINQIDTANMVEGQIYPIDDGPDGARFCLMREKQLWVSADQMIWVRADCWGEVDHRGAW